MPLTFRRDLSFFLFDFQLKKHFKVDEECPLEEYLYKYFRIHRD